MIAFVLSGGASLGAIQVGMLHALYERGIAPDNLIGGVKAAPIDAVVERMAAGWNALWH